MGDGSQSTAVAGREFLPVPASAPAAREFVASIDDFGVVEDVLRLKTLTSELVTNAILHARTPFSVTVTGNDRQIRVTVRDGSTELPVKRNYGPDKATGRGLHIVEALADRWGIRSEDGGKSVWFELDLESAAS